MKEADYGAAQNRPIAPPIPKRPRDDPWTDDDPIVSPKSADPQAGSDRPPVPKVAKAAPKIAKSEPIFVSSPETKDPPP